MTDHTANLHARLWDIANTLRGKMGADEFRDYILQCLGDRPSVLQARRVGERILERMRDFVSTFVEGMVG